MKVTQVAICPSQASTQAGRPALTPELLAASGARYSRNNEGLESILARIDPNNLEKSVDSIFRMVDYGHQSIADMVPVAMFIDRISIWLAYYLWTLCPTAGGQESSTRYIKICADGLIPPEALGIPAHAIPEWRRLMDRSFQAYQVSLQLWEGLARKSPALVGIPASLLNEDSEIARKKVARMRRNYAFDRARYFLPVSAATNVMLLMSARGWVNLCQYLLSHSLPEPRALGERIRAELEIPAPRMLKHASSNEANHRALADEFDRLVRRAKAAEFSPGMTVGTVGDKPRRSAEQIPDPAYSGHDAQTRLSLLVAPAAEPALTKSGERPDSSSKPFLSVMIPQGVSEEELTQALRHHANRYAPMGSDLQRTAVRFGWPAVSFAEIRDLNRHRTGTKFCPLVPGGFYFAIDQLPAGAGESRALLLEQADTGRYASATALDLLRQAESSYVYWSLLGTEYPFEHTTTADKFIYEAELRTGLGAHFRYAKHLRDILRLWYERFPATKGMILEGSAEPE